MFTALRSSAIVLILLGAAAALAQVQPLPERPAVQPLPERPAMKPSPEQGARSRRSSASDGGASTGTSKLPSSSAPTSGSVALANTWAYTSLPGRSPTYYGLMLNGVCEQGVCARASVP